MIEDGEIYIVVDIESDGPIPGVNSMLSIGAVATTNDKEVGQFYKTLAPMASAVQAEYTMAWWDLHPIAWKEATENSEPAETVMELFEVWIASFGKQPVFVAHPTGFDYSFVSWYFWRHLNRNPFSSAAGGGRTLDLQSYIAGKLGIPLKDAHRKNLPESVRPENSNHTHNAIDDAREYAEILRKALNVTK